MDSAGPRADRQNLAGTSHRRLLPTCLLQLLSLAPCSLCGSRSLSLHWILHPSADALGLCLSLTEGTSAQLPGLLTPAQGPRQRPHSPPRCLSSTLLHSVPYPTYRFCPHVSTWRVAPQLTCLSSGKPSLTPSPAPYADPSLSTVILPGHLICPCLSQADNSPGPTPCLCHPAPGSSGLVPDPPALESPLPLPSGSYLLLGYIRLPSLVPSLIPQQPQSYNRGNAR